MAHYLSMFAALHSLLILFMWSSRFLVFPLVRKDLVLATDYSKTPSSRVTVAMGMRTACFCSGPNLPPCGEGSLLRFQSGELDTSFHGTGMLIKGPP